MFTSPARFYLKNIDLAQHTHATPGLQKTPDDREEPTVIVFTRDAFRCILPLDDALRVATQIADAIQYHKENTPA